MGFLTYSFYQKSVNPSYYDNFLFKQSDTYQTMKDNIEKVVDVPAETPSIAQVADIATLKQSKPEVYAAAENDDVIFLYSTKLIIYRPSENKIVNVVNVNN